MGLDSKKKEKIDFFLIKNCFTDDADACASALLHDASISFHPDPASRCGSWNLESKWKKKYTCFIIPRRCDSIYKDFPITELRYVIN